MSVPFRSRLSTRVAFAASAVALFFVLLTGGGAWLVTRTLIAQQVNGLLQTEAILRAERVSDLLDGVIANFHALAANTVVANALVDSVGRETYLQPLLADVSQVNNLPAEAVVTDFQGRVLVASNPAVQVPAEWVAEAVAEGMVRARLETDASGPLLMVAEPVIYANTRSPEGALVWRLPLRQVVARSSSGRGAGIGELRVGGNDAQEHYHLPFGDILDEDRHPLVAEAPVMLTRLSLPFSMSVRVGVEQAFLDASLDRLRSFLLFIGAVATLLVVIVSLLVGRRLTRKLSRLTSAASSFSFAASDRRVFETKGDDEIAQLGGAFASMVERLDRAYHDLEGRSHTMLSNVVRDLQRSNEELEQFAYVASHDLRQPLRTVRSYITLVEQSLLGKLDPESTEFMDFIRSGVTRMDALITDLLAYSRVGRATQDAPVDIAEAVQMALRDLGAQIEESAAIISVASPLPVVQGDAGETTRLFQNLIGNALKYRGSSPLQIVISCQDRGLDWEFMVQDNGIGIPPEHAERIFGIFQRLHARDEYEGTGIGLAICRKMVERHGGHIWVEPTPGGGAAFHFTRPK